MAGGKKNIKEDFHIGWQRPSHPPQFNTPEPFQVPTLFKGIILNAVVGRPHALLDENITVCTLNIELDVKHLALATKYERTLIKQDANSTKSSLE